LIKCSTFRIQIICPGCNNNHAVSGIVDYDTCQNCGKTINVRSVLQDRMFGFMDRVQYISGFLSGSIEQIGGTGAYRLQYSSMPCTCEECKSVIETGLLTKAIEETKPVICPSCDHKMPVRKADNEIKQFHPKAIGIINDSHGADYAKKDIDKNSMLVFKCMTCGGALELGSDTKRTIKCNYCDNENYLPDNIWTKLHPNKEVQPLFILLDLTEEDIKGSIDYFLRVTALSIYSKHFENFIREYFERPFVNESLLTWVKHLLRAKNNEQVSFNMDIIKVQKNFYDNLKLGLDTHSEELKSTVAEYGVNIPPELQLLLAGDKCENVRIELAKNENLKKDVIKKLQGDKSAEVSRLASKQKTGFLGKLFG
jgi:DNA-directed RNA polymerase subunit RPC12/RpoP